MLQLLLSAAFAAPAPPIVGGEVTDDWPAVALLWVNSVCSGTLIAPRWILTAEHCSAYLDDPTEGIAYFGGDVWGYEITEEVPFAAWHTYDGPQRDAPYAWDLALVELSRDVVGVDPLPLFGGHNDAWWGSEITYVGFGKTGTTAEDYGIKRAVHGVDPYHADYTYLYTYEPGLNFCGGDSGGAMLIPAEAGGYALAGVNAFVWAKDKEDDSCEEGGAAASRVENALAWIRELVPEAQVYTVEGPEDTGEPVDTGEPEDSAEPDDTAPPAGEEDPGEPEREKGGCSAVPGGRAAWALAGLLALRRRKRGSVSGPPGRPR